jgi:hypothetical protein
LLPHCSRNNPQHLNKRSSPRARFKDVDKDVGRQLVLAVAARRRNGMSRCRPGQQQSPDESLPPIPDVPSGARVS